MIWKHTYQLPLESKHMPFSVSVKISQVPVSGIMKDVLYAVVYNQNS